MMMMMDDDQPASSIRIRSALLLAVAVAVGLIDVEKGEVKTRFLSFSLEK